MSRLLPRAVLTAIALVTALAALACDGGSSMPAVTATVGTPLTTATSARPSAAPPTTTPTRPAPTPTGFPRVEGTIDPLGFGGVDPVTVKSNPDPLTGAALLTAVRVGRHPEEGGWDRIVFEFRGGLPPGRVEYVASATQCGSGAAVSLPGSAILQVRFEQANAHTDAGQATIDRQMLPGPGGAILQAQQTCDFEAHVTWAIGVTAKQRFKVTTLSSPTRLIIDIKW